MKIYYVNMRKNSQDQHEVHRQDCDHLPPEICLMILGKFNTLSEAVTEAGKTYDDVTTCALCEAEFLPIPSAKTCC